MSEKNIAVLGLGYVGLPLALELSLTLNVKGFDVNNNRINQLRKGIDSTLEAVSYTHLRSPRDCQ